MLIRQGVLNADGSTGVRTGEVVWVRWTTTIRPAK